MLGCNLPKRIYAPYVTFFDGLFSHLTNCSSRFYLLDQYNT